MHGYVSVRVSLFPCAPALLKALPHVSDSLSLSALTLNPPDPPPLQCSEHVRCCYANHIGSCQHARGIPLFALLLQHSSMPWCLPCVPLLLRPRSTTHIPPSLNLPPIRPPSLGFPLMPRLSSVAHARVLTGHHLNPREFHPSFRRPSHNPSSESLDSSLR